MINFSGRVGFDIPLYSCRMPGRSSSKGESKEIRYDAPPFPVRDPLREKGAGGMFKYHFFFRRRLCFFLLLFSILGCKDIPRDNPLDPKNPSGTRERKVLIEAFVNINDSLQVNINEYALAALDTLKAIYPGKLVIVDYHRNTLQYLDPYHLLENETLYRHYIARFDSMAGVPDIFINGTLRRVQGASSVANSITRISAALSGMLNQNSSFSLEIEYRQSGDLVTPEVRVARLGDSDARDITLKAVLIAQIDQGFLKRVVRDISTTRISLIEAGTFQTVTLTALQKREPQFRHFLAVYITDAPETEALQCDMIEIE